MPWDLGISLFCFALLLLFWFLAFFTCWAQGDHCPISRSKASQPTGPALVLKDSVTSLTQSHTQPCLQPLGVRLPMGDLTSLSFLFCLCQLLLLRNAWGSLSVPSSCPLSSSYSKNLGLCSASVTFRVHHNLFISLTPNSDTSSLWSLESQSAQIHNWVSGTVFS